MAAADAGEGRAHSRLGPPQPISAGVGFRAACRQIFPCCQACRGPRPMRWRCRCGTRRHQRRHSAAGALRGGCHKRQPGRTTPLPGPAPLAAQLQGAPRGRQEAEREGNWLGLTTQRHVARRWESRQAGEQPARSCACTRWAATGTGRLQARGVSVSGQHASRERPAGASCDAGRAPARLVGNAPCSTASVTPNPATLDGGRCARLPLPTLMPSNIIITARPQGGGSKETR